MEKHTPGPWKSDISTKPWFVRDVAGKVICASGGAVGKDNPADARLIAAAPKMLRLLQRLGGANPGPSQTFLREYPALEEELLVLIAKAEGRIG